MRIPPDLLPADGRFGSGPSRIRRAQLDVLAGPGAAVLGTSHRQEPVRALVRRVREGVAALLQVPDGYEVVLGNGGSTAFWDVATGALVADRVQHLVHGEFAAKFAACTARAPFVAESVHVHAEPGSLASPYAVAGVDTYAWPHNETSTGVLAPILRVPDADPDALLLVDATSAAGGVAVDVSQTDAYYFAPQKALGSEGGLWVAVLSPAALARAELLAGSGRWVPDSLSLMPFLMPPRPRRRCPRRCRSPPRPRPASPGRACRPGCAPDPTRRPSRPPSRAARAGRRPRDGAPGR